jgi:hypothetical protein
MKKGAFLYIVLGLFLIAVIYIMIVLSKGRTTFFGRASGEGVFDSTNSYVFASPLSARAGGDKIRVTVFALDGQGKGMAAKTVTVDCLDTAACQSAGVTISEVQGLTDTLGQAIYDLSSRVPGKFQIQALVGGIVIPQTVSIAFQ